MTKDIFPILLPIFIFGLGGCIIPSTNGEIILSSPSDGATVLTESYKVPPAVTDVNVEVDSSFTPTELMEIVQDLDVWKAALKGTFGYSITSKNNLAADISSFNTIRIINREEKVEPQFVGETWNYTSPKSGVIQAYIEIRQPMEDVQFKGVVLHELGHALGLKHYSGPEPSVMEPAYSEHQLEVHPVDVRAFCVLEGC